MTAPFLDQISFRARGDTVGLNVDTWDHALNANFTQAVDTNFRVRFTIAETAGGMANNRAFTLEYNLNDTGFVAIGAVGGPEAVLTSLTDQFANGDPTTQLISSGSFVAGIGVEQTTTSNITLSSQRTEVEWCLQLNSAAVANNDTLTLRVVQDDSTVLDSYTSTPTITVSETGGTINEPSIAQDKPYVPDYRTSAIERLREDLLLVGDSVVAEKFESTAVVYDSEIVQYGGETVEYGVVAQPTEQTETDHPLLDDRAVRLVEHVAGDGLLLPDQRASQVERRQTDRPVLDDDVLAQVVRGRAESDQPLLDDRTRREFGHQQQSLGLVLDDVVGRIIEHTITDRLLVGDSVSVVTAVLTDQTERDSLFLRDAAIRDVAHGDADEFILDDRTVAAHEIVVTDRLIIGDSVAAIAVTGETVSDGVLALDRARRELHKTITDRLLAGDSVAVEAAGVTAETVSDGLFLADVARVAIERAVRDYLLIGDSVTSAVVRALLDQQESDGLILGDRVRRDVARNLRDGLLIGDSVDAILAAVITREASDGLLFAEARRAVVEHLDRLGLAVDDAARREIEAVAQEGLLAGDRVTVGGHLSRSLADGLLLGDQSTAQVTRFQVFPDARRIHYKVSISGRGAAKAA